MWRQPAREHGDAGNSIVHVLCPPQHVVTRSANSAPDISDRSRITNDPRTILI